MLIWTKNGKSTKWKVENSWGDKVGTDGYFVASDAWMDEYTYQIVVRKELLTAEERAAYEAEPIVLAPWDPMGLGRIKRITKKNQEIILILFLFIHSRRDYMIP